MSVSEFKGVTYAGALKQQELPALENLDLKACLKRISNSTRKQKKVRAQLVCVRVCMCVYVCV